MKKKLVVHLAETPLAGAPIRIVNALNEYSEFQARLINYNPKCYGTRTFPEDIDWNDETKSVFAMDLIRKADIFHIYHPIQVDSVENVFGINFVEINPTAKFLYQFESNKKHFCQQKIDYIDTMRYYKSVIIHYPERDFIGYPNLPNIIDLETECLKPKDTKNKIPVVFYSPSSPHGVACNRWNSKGKPEVLKALRMIQRKVDFEIRLVENTPYEECMQIKRDSDIVIDDITTGSFHLSALEGLSMGKPTISFLDGRSVAVCSALTGSRDLPFVNVRLRELEKPLLMLLRDKSLRENVGEYSRYWMETYYNTQRNVGIYEDLYSRVLSAGEGVGIELGEKAYLQAKEFLYREVNDFIWGDYFSREINKQAVIKRLKLWKPKL